jgi:hypothetical protein
MINNTEDTKIYKTPKELRRRQRYLISSTAIGLISLIASFGEPLQKLTVYKQRELGVLKQERWDTYVITENSRSLPYGFVKERAINVAQIREDFKFQKFVFLTIAFLSTVYSLSIADEIIKDSELDESVQEQANTARKEILTKELMLLFGAKMKEASLEAYNRLQGIYNSYGEDVPEYQSQMLDQELMDNKPYEVGEMVRQGHTLEHAIEKVYKLPQDSDEFKNVHREFLEE